VTDANGDTTWYDYDSLSRLTEVLRGNSIAKYYYLDGKLSEIEVNNFRYKINYDNLGRFTSIQVADMTLVQYVYETYGSYKTDRIDEQIYGNGDSIKYIYNSEDQVTQIQFKESGSSTYVTRYEFEYDFSGNLAVYIDNVSKKQYYYNYDFSGRLQEVTDEVGNTVSYEYDAENGSLSQYGYNIYSKNNKMYYIYDTKGVYDKTSLTTSNGSVVKDYLYEDTSTGNTLGRLTDITIKMDSTIILNTKYEYYDDTLSDPNIVTNGNAFFRIIKLTIGTRTQDFEYDNNGNITKITDSKTGVTRFEYDNIGQLISEDNPVSNKTYHYQYDDNGNILHMRSYSETTTVLTENLSTLTFIDSIDYYYQMIGWMDQLEGYEGVIDGQYFNYYFEYDNLGNPLTDQFNTYAWDGRELRSITNPNYTIDYKYNSDGYRTEKTVNGVTTKYYLDGDKVLYESNGTTTLNYYYDTLIGFSYNNNDYFYTRNNFGDIIEIRDKNGAVKVTYEYDAWGILLAKQIILV